MKSLDSGWFSQVSKLMFKSPLMKMFLFSLVNWDRMDSRCFLNLTGYRQDQNIQDILVHTSIKSQSGSPAGTYPCDAPRCRMCVHVSATTIINGPRHNITIREHFTCKSSNVVYCISCLCCLVLYIGETGACSDNALVNTFEPLWETRQVFLLQNISTTPDTD